MGSSADDACSISRNTEYRGVALGRDSASIRSIKVRELRIKYRMAWLVNTIYSGVNVQFQTKVNHKTPGKLCGQAKLPESWLFQMRTRNYSRLLSFLGTYSAGLSLLSLHE